MRDFPVWFFFWFVQFDNSFWEVDEIHLKKYTNIQLQKRIYKQRIYRKIIKQDSYLITFQWLSKEGYCCVLKEMSRFFLLLQLIHDIRYEENRTHLKNEIVNWIINVWKAKDFLFVRSKKIISVFASSRKYF